MPRTGRPRQYKELEELRKESKAQRESMIRKIREIRGKPTRFDFAWEAATVLHTLEKSKLSAALEAVCADRTEQLRKTNFGHAVDPYSRMHPPAFLEAFIQKCVPGWDWRTMADDKTETEERAELDERYTQELAQMLRDSRVHRNRHVLPDAPDPTRFIFLLRRIRPNEPITWPSLKEMKLATGISERRLREIIKTIRPKKSELVVKTPKRFGPRVLLCVVEDFLSRYPNVKLTTKQRDDCIAAGRQLKQRFSYPS